MNRLVGFVAGFGVIGLLLGSSSGMAQTADQKRAVIRTYADIAHAGYEDSLTGARRLLRTVETLIAEPSEQTLAAARKAWLGLVQHLDPDANVTDVCVGTNKAFQEVGGDLETQLKFYLERARKTGDLDEMVAIARKGGDHALPHVARRGEAGDENDVRTAAPHDDAQTAGGEARPRGCRGQRGQSRSSGREKEFPAFHRLLIPSPA